MDGGDLKTLNRWHGGDLKTLSRQHGGIFGLLGKLFGLGPGELQKQMSDPIKQQMIMHRGGFPWALAGLSLLPALLGKGEEDRIRNQMQMTRDPIMQIKRRVGNTTDTHLQRSTASQTDRYPKGNGCSGFFGR